MTKRPLASRRLSRAYRLLALVAPLALGLTLPATGWAAPDDEPPPPKRAPRAAVQKAKPGQPLPPAPPEEAVEEAPAADAEKPAAPDAEKKAEDDKPAPTADAEEQKLPDEGNDFEARAAKRSELLMQMNGGPTVTLETSPTHPPTVTDEMHLEEAVAFALKNNFEVKAAAERTVAAQWDLAATYGQYLPVIEYIRDTGKEESKPAAYHLEPTPTERLNGVTQGQLMPDDAHKRRDRSWGVHQTIVDLSVIADILGRHKNEDMVETDERGIRERVAMDTIASFFRVIRAELAIRYANDYKSALDKIAARMDDRVKGGGASGVELERIRGRSVATRSAIIEARSEFESAMVEFRRLSGVMPLKLQIGTRLLPIVPQSVDAVLDRAYAYNPDLLSAQKKVEVTRYDAVKAHARMLPKLTFDMTDIRTYNAGGSAYDTAGGTIAYPYTDSLEMMGTLTWTLNGGVDFGEGMSSLASARQSAFAADDTRLRLEEAVRTAYDALTAANGRIEALQKSVASNMKVAAAFEEQYRAGTRPLLDLLDIEERLYQSRVELTRLVLAEAQAGYIVRRQMGELVPAILSTDKEP